MQSKKWYLVVLVAFAFSVFSCNDTEPTSADVQKDAIVAVLGTKSELSEFVALFKGLDVAALEANEFTVFAVSNAGMSEDEGVVLKRHIVVGKHTKSSLNDGDKLTALDGTELVIAVADAQVFVNGVELGDEISAGNSVAFVVGKPIPAVYTSPDNGESATATLRVVNSDGYGNISAINLYIPNSSYEIAWDWGAFRDSDGNSITPGTARNFEVPVGTFNLFIAGWEKDGVVFAAGKTTTATVSNEGMDVSSPQ